MKIFEILLIGIALSMDAFAITIANCTSFLKSLTRKKEWAMPVAFAVFQFIMPIIGYYIGSLFMSNLLNYTDYISFIVFLLLSLKIVYDNVKEIKEKEIAVNDSKKFTLWILIIQAVATSIDALVIGITFSNNSLNIFLSSGIIGIVTFFIVSGALFIGKSLGKILGKYATWLGATILFALSVKNLITALL